MISKKIQSCKALVWDFWQNLNCAPCDTVPIVSRYVHDDVLWQGPRPLGDIRGREELVASAVAPMLVAIPDIKREPYIFLGGEYENQVWVAGMGDFVGTFANDWLGIPATGGSIRMRFGEFLRIEDAQIVEVYTLFDIIDLMSQSGFEVLPPGPGRDIHPPGPSTASAVLLEEQDAKISKQSLGQLEDMLFKGMNYRTRNSGGSMQGYWQPDMVWYGQKGMGSSFGLDEFQRNAQGTILQAYPDRIGGFHLVRLGEGECAAMGGLRTLQGTHTGDFLGIAATGNSVAWRIMDFYTLKDGLLFENWNLIDLIDACSQIGVDLFERMRAQL